MEGGCSDNAVGHFRNEVPRNTSQHAGDLGIKRNDRECGTVRAKFANKPVEGVGGNSLTFYQINNLDQCLVTRIRAITACIRARLQACRNAVPPMIAKAFRP